MNSRRSLKFSVNASNVNNLRTLLCRNIFPRGFRSTFICLLHVSLASLLMETSAQPAVMKAVMQTETGGPEVLSLHEVPVPRPGPREVLIKIGASAINRADTLQRRGLYAIPPGATSVFGLEAAGEVGEIGSSSSGKWKAGDRVMALLPGGGNAQYATAHEDHLIPIPDHMTVQQAAAIPEVWLTAYQLLYFVASLKKGDVVLIHAGGSGVCTAATQLVRQARATPIVTAASLKKGDVVLIHAGGSGVGTAATQLVRQAGATPIVTAGTEAKLQKARSLGALGAFNYKEVDFAEKVLEVTKGRGVDIILDCIGQSYWQKNAKSIAVDGTWVLYGLMGGRAVDGPLLGDILRKRINLKGSTLRSRSDEYKAELVQSFTDNALPHFTPSSQGGDADFQPIVDQVFPFHQIAQAHQYMDENKTLGKVILSVEHGSAKSEL